MHFSPDNNYWSYIYKKSRNTSSSRKDNAKTQTIYREGRIDTHIFDNFGGNFFKRFKLQYMS